MGRNKEDVCVVGLGYAGLTMAAALADKGYGVFGYDIDAAKVAALSRAEVPFHEAGVEDVLRRCLGRNLHLASDFPRRHFDVIVFAVATPVDVASKQPVLDHLLAAARTVVASLDGDDPLIIVRSTVPVGTTERHLLPLFRAARPNVLLAFAPERTIQGQALREIVELPQIVGGVDERSLRRAVQFFEGLARSIVPVSSTATAELVKLLNNAHTDVIYSFGNEAAKIAEALGVDPVEALRAASLDYPRPRLHSPGYVGGGCLTKDPYILMASVPSVRPALLQAARALNEDLPRYTAQRVLDGLAAIGVPANRARILMCGIAFKGEPPTDDLRGSQALEIIPIFRAAGTHVVAHDPMLSAARLSTLGVEGIADLQEVTDANAAVVLTTPSCYRQLTTADILARLTRPAVLFDAWRLYDRRETEAAGVRYQSIGI